MTRSLDTTPPTALRHFRRLLCFVGALFLTTEVVALTGLVPHLQPVSFRELSANILFAIGFGCPLVLYLSSLPPWRHILRTAAAGLLLSGALWAVHHALGAPQLITGLGLASLGALGLQAWRNTGPARTTALLYLLPAAASLVFTLQVGIMFNLVSSVFPLTYDSYAYVADGAHGVQLSFVIGRLFAALPALGWICFAIYVAPPPGLVFVYALQTRARRRPPVDVVTVLLFLGLAGYSLYFLCPVCGPRFAFGPAFPWAPPPLRDFLGIRIPVGHAPRDGMPSLHMASVLLAYWHARPYGWWARGVAAVFVLGTFLATMGVGEHYFVDLVVAFPFTLAIHSACTPGLPALRRPRRAAFLGAAALVVLWYTLLLAGQSILLLSPVLTWAVTLATVGIVLRLEWRLYRAAAQSAEKAASARPRIAPGPRGHFLLGHLPAFRRDVLGLLLEGRRQCGDVVRFRLGPLLIHLVSHPEQIKHVLVTNQHNYNKDTRSSAKIRSVTGEGLLTSNGEAWLQQRRLMQPAFHPQRLAAFADVMTRTTAVMLQRWQKHAAGGQPLNVASEMMRLTYTIVGTCLFGADVTQDIEDVEQAAADVLRHTYHRLETIVDLPPGIPTPRNLRFRRALRRIDEIVYRIIHDRQQSADRPGDLLSLLLHRRDEDTGRGMSAQQVRNETITLLLAGHETTANALTWTWYLLSQHPVVAERARAEIVAVLGGRLPGVQDLPHLKYTTQVIQESMRLYPPIWIMERRVLAEDEIGGYLIPAGSTVVVCPYVTHRHPDFWENAEEFDPERFLPERSAGRPAYAYLPFGGGQRLCIGSNFALMEAQLILAMVLPLYRPQLVPGFAVKPMPGITLRSQQGLWMTLHPPAQTESSHG